LLLSNGGFVAAGALLLPGGTKEFTFEFVLDGAGTTGEEVGWAGAAVVLVAVVGVGVAVGTGVDGGTGFS
jgi:hypothetical protein